MNQPKLSIIVPGYNVEEYIEACLDSILAQKFTDYEVLMIDDESPDSTGEIMDRYAAEQPNFRVIHKLNEGISAARNLGINESRGEYIAFLDSDDLLTETAYQELVGSLDRTGSQMAIGGVKRFNSQKEVYSFLHRKAIKDTALKTTIRQHPELIYDTTVWNKVYRRKFLIDQGIRFPEGVIYEDISFTLHAHLTAKAVDILDTIVYKWRWREGDNRSWTQHRNDLALYQQRLVAIDQALTLAEEYRAPELIEPLKVKALEVDIPLFIPEKHHADLDYVVEFQKMTYRKIHELGLEYLAQVRPDKQAQLVALLHGDLEVMVDFVDGETWSSQVEERKGTFVFANEMLNDKDWQKEIQLEHSLPLMSKIGTIATVKQNHFMIHAAAFAKHTMHLKPSLADYQVFLTNTNTDEKIRLPFLQKRTKLEKSTMRLPLKVGLDIELDFNRLAEQLTEGIWKIEVCEELKNITSVGFLGNPQKGAAKIATFLLEDHVVRLHYNNDWQLTFIVTKAETRISSLVFAQDRLKLSGQLPAFVTKGSLYDLENDHGEHFFELTKEGADLVSEPLTLLFHTKYQLKLYDDFYNEVLYINQLTDLPKRITAAQPIVLYSTGLTNLKFEFLAGVVSLREAQVVDQKLQVSLVCEKVPNARYQLRLLQEHKKYRYQLTEYRETTAGLDFISDLTPEAEFLIRPGKYDVFLDVITDEVTSYRISLDGMEKQRLTEIAGFTLNSYETPNGFWRISSVQKWAWLDNSRLKRRISYSILYPLMRLLPLKKQTVVYDSFWSAAINDNPKAMYDYLRQAHPELEHVWLLETVNLPVAGPAKKVRKNSFRYWYYLARAKYLIENTNLPNQYAKRQGQIEVQTFHGTFMKTMGFDEPYFKNAKKSVQNNFARRNSRWDLVTSPSPYMTEKISSAFDYQREIVESGFPRNDVLYTENRPEVIEKLKMKLGLPSDKKIVLYAPTYRTKEGFELALDLQQLQEKLGDEIVLLVRLHYFVSNNINIENFAPFARDVSNYPSIEELYLVSDLLITDYSSVMFDYAHLKRPMLFFAYDLEEYTQDLRGVYLDYEEIVPGPIVRDTAEIIEALTDPHPDQYAAKQAAFYDRFCVFGQEGNAAQQASEAMLGLTTSESETEPLIREKFKRLFKYNKWYPKYLEHVGKKPKKKLIVFESFFGRKYSDNPKAIYEYMRKHHPEYQVVWNINKEYEAYFKEHKLPYVERLSLRGVRTIARAEYWVMNTRLPLWMKKPKGTTMIQTWHGTPLKTLGRDVELLTMPGLTADSYHADVIKDSNKWDYCLSPNAYSTEIFQRAFRLRSEQMINSGYPRNDILLAHTPTDVQRIKQQLGISVDKKVVLYAPTWRDNEYLKADHYTAKLHLDLARFKEELGKDVILLIRTHYLIANSLDIADDEQVLDVSEYQDINDLYLISDLLITDYSSVFFDFANLERPMIFYAYDLASYAGEIRGFYFDYSEAPGPILETEDALYPEIRKQLQQPTLAPNFAEFKEKYCGWEDGHSAERAVSFILNGESYQHRTLSRLSEEAELTADIALWSDVIGEKGYHITKNILAEGQSVQILEKAVLIDPIQRNYVGTPCYLVEINQEKGWITETDYFNLKA